MPELSAEFSCWPRNASVGSQCHCPFFGQSLLGSGCEHQSAARRAGGPQLGQRLSSRHAFAQIKSNVLALRSDGCCARLCEGQLDYQQLPLTMFWRHCTCNPNDNGRELGHPSAEFQFSSLSSCMQLSGSLQQLASNVSPVVVQIEMSGFGLAQDTCECTGASASALVLRYFDSALPNTHVFSM
jgi:hypothetical protein